MEAAADILVPELRKNFHRFSKPPGTNRRKFSRLHFW
jgi:hypothetical protein